MITKLIKYDEINEFLIKCECEKIYVTLQNNNDMYEIIRDFGTYYAFNKIKQEVELIDIYLIEQILGISYEKYNNKSVRCFPVKMK